MISRFRLALLAGVLGLAGCGDAFHAGPIRFVHEDRLAGEEFAQKPKLRAKVIAATHRLFGESPQRLRVPEGTGLPEGGLHLGNLVELGEPNARRLAAITYIPPGGETPVVQEGGQALYRRHCLHCHGVSGDGRGPTAEFLFPRPRDFRRGLFKFTSTAVGAKPTRSDLRKTIRQGLPGTSMPSFDALMVPEEIEQVIDFVIFLSMRGEVERLLVEEALISDENDPEALAPDIVQEYATGVFEAWKAADSQVVVPEVPRVASSPESLEQGKTLFLGRTAENLKCTDCHGPGGEGNGTSFVSLEVFHDVVFGGDPSTMDQRLSRYDEPTRTLWRDGSLDEWGDPLRPADLNRGIYKGGRRPIDLYWRIAKGINGAKMPSHAALKPEQIWHLVNFVLALPYQPELLRDVPAVGAPAAPPAAVARR